MELLNYLFGLIQGLVGDSSLGRMVFIALMSIAVFALCLALLLLVSWVFRPEKGRLKELSPALVDAPKGTQSFGKVLASGGKMVQPKLSAMRSRYQTMLVTAGYRNTGAISVFYGCRLLAMVVLPLIVLFLTAITLKLDPFPVLLFSTAAFMVGLVLPSLMLEKRMKKRQKELNRGLPDALDLLVVCTEAGLGLKAALDRVANDIQISHPALGEEFATVNAQTRVGIENVTALKDLADRTGLPEMRSLVVALSQSLRFGTNLADTLRVFSEELRDKRIQAAEEAAAMVSTKMLFPLVLCVFPSFFVVALGPPMLGAMAALRATGG